MLRNGLKHLSLLFCALLLSAAAVAQVSYTEGRHYSLVNPAVAVADAEKIQVVELFRYDCGGCFQFDKVVKPWRDKLAGDVTFEYLPVTVAGRNETYARAYYAAHALKILDRSHKRIFDRIHLDRKPLTDIGDVVTIFEELGVDTDTARKTLQSFAITTKVKNAQKRYDAYDSNTTPTLIVQGRYRIEINSDVRNYDEMLEVVSYLINQVRQQRSAG